MALKYGGKTISDYSAMRGPCPEGFHVPMSSERSAVVNTGVSLGARTTSGTTSVTNFRTYLKLPNIVYLFPGNGLPGTGRSPQHRYYWGCRQTGSDGSGRYCDALDVVEDYGGSIKVDDTSSNHGCPVRPFRDKPVAPDSNWTVLYDGSSVATGAGIFYNATLGLISISSDGITWITIADKNAGATSVYNFGDTITSANGGGLYQWGNNYPFSIDGATTTSSTRVDTTGYGPGNYYSGSTFITGSANDDWFSPRNRDLWGGVTGIQQKPVNIVERYYGGKLINDYSAMRGPCDEGFHIPTISEAQTLVSMKNTLSFDYATYLHSPSCGWVYPDGDRYANEGGWWLCEASDIGSSGRIIYQGGAITGYGASHGFSVRPFKDKAIVPDNSRTREFDGSSVASGAGVFHSVSLGLISISADGTNWITIADKNLGATAVWNSGNSMSQSNVGKYYQRGNNYGFNRGSQSATAGSVDTTGYGPGNYYSSSTRYIGVGDTSYEHWYNPINRDLRGGVTGVQQHPTKVIEVYYGSTKIWPETYEVSYNLRGGSLNGWIDAGGDTITTNTSYGFDSNGMYITGSGTDKYFALFAELPDLTNAKKITVSFSAYFISGSWSNNKRLGIASINNRDYASGDFLLLSLAYNSSSPSRYNGAGLSNVVNNSEQWLQKEAVGYATGDVVATLEIDLTTGGLVGTITGANTKNYSATLSSSQLEAIKTYKYVFYEKEEGYQFRNERLKDVYFKVEY